MNQAVPQTGSGREQMAELDGLRVVVAKTGRPASWCRGAVRPSGSVRQAMRAAEQAAERLAVLS